MRLFHLFTPRLLRFLFWVHRHHVALGKIAVDSAVILPLTVALYLLIHPLFDHWFGVLPAQPEKVLGWLGYTDSTGSGTVTSAGLVPSGPASAVCVPAAGNATTATTVWICSTLQSTSIGGPSTSN